MPSCSTRCSIPSRSSMSIYAASRTVTASRAETENTPMCNNLWIPHLPMTRRNFVCSS